jgi:tellurite resistance protein TehA-like permease
MATGIVSLGLVDRGLPALSTALLWFAAAAYLTLVVLHVWRAMAFPEHLRRDLVDPARGFGFFTFVAGTDVLGARIAEVQPVAATALLAVGVLGWLVLGYLVPWTAVVGGAHRPVLAAANGTWFIWVVATQSVAVLIATIQPTVRTGRVELSLLAVVCWSVGALLYAALGVLVAARLLLYDLSPTDVTPPYWVAMGATAITVLAGARIVEMADAPVLTATRDLIAGTCVVFWAFGTWLIPPLIAAGWWRHVVHRVPLRYEPPLWSIIFPLGMYGVATRALGEADHLPVVGAIGRGEIWLALAAWTATAGAMLTHLVRTLLRRGP